MADGIHRNSLKPGHRLHWYRIERVLGQGGFGITYLAHDLNLEQRVAIKEYLPIPSWAAWRRCTSAASSIATSAPESSKPGRTNSLRHKS